MKCIEDEIPYKEPLGWCWCRIGTLFQTITGNTPSTKDSLSYGNDYPFYKPADLDPGFYVSQSSGMVSNKGYDEGRQVPKLSVLVTCIGTIGKTGLIRKEGICNQQINAILPNNFCNPEYTFFEMCSDYEQEQMTLNSSATTLSILNKSKFDNLLFILPPITEQKKIADQVQSVFSLIEIIESEKLSLKELIDHTKSKILDLAIRGKLLAQDPSDEPASFLLERIRNEKDELIKAGKLKKDKRESVIFRGEDNSYYLRTGKLVEPLTDWSFDNLPTNWEICCFGEICNYGDCINTESSVIENSAWILDLEDIEKDTGRIISRVSKADRPSISTKHKFHKGQVLYSKLRPYLNKVVLADRDGYCTSEILPLEFHAEIIPEYARYYLMSPTFLRYADKCSYGVKMPRLGTNDGKKAIFPLPPVNEQKRIVKQIEFMFSHLSVIETSVQ